MKKLLIFFGLLLQLGLAQAQTYYTFYEVRDDAGNPLVNYPMQFHYTSGASGTITSVTGLDPLNPAWITFYGSSSSICGNIETVHPGATIISGSVWSCLASPGPNNYIRVKNTNSSSFKINGSLVSTSSGSPSVFLFCDAATLNWTNYSWYSGNISSATFKIYNYTSGTDVLISNNSYGSGGAPAGINLSAAGFIGNKPGKYRLELSNNFGGTVITYNGYIHIKDVSLSISGTYQTKANNLPATPVSVTPFGPYNDTPSNNPLFDRVIVGRTGTIFSISAATDITGGVGVCSLEVHIDKYSGSGIWSLDYISPTTYSSACTTMSALSLPIGGFTDDLGDPFFTNANAPVNSIWRLRLEVITPCGVIKRALAFQMGERPTATTSGYVKEARPGREESSIRFAPVPFAAKLSAVSQLAENSQVSLNIYSIDGRLMATPYINTTLKAGATTLDIETGSWPAGIYLYEYSINGEKISGKISK